MARGARKTALDTSQQGYNSSQQFNTQLNAQNQKLQGLVIPGYENMVANPGYDAATKAGVVSASQGATGAAYGSAADSMERRAARTGNSAGVIEGEDQLARDKATTMATQASENQLKFADAARSDVKSGLQGMSGMYGMDQQLLARSLGIPVEYLGLYAKNAPGGFEQIMGNLIASGGQVGAAAAAGDK